MSIPVDLRRGVHLLPSILSADFSRLGEEVGNVMDGGAKIIHVDVMDGHFVPNITVGPLVVQALAPLVHEREGYLSVHLMIERPEDYIEEFAASGADALSVHVETCARPYRTLETIRALGVSGGIALNPGSDVKRLVDLTPYADFVLVMTVNPGFGGQKLIAPALAKIPELRQLLGDDAAIEVDGGINRENVCRAVEAGANWVVTGSAVFGAEDPRAEVEILQGLMAGCRQV